MTKQIYNPIFLIFLYSLIINLYSAPLAHAAGIDLGVTPPLLQIEAKPPADLKAPIILENNSDEEVTLRIMLQPFTASQKGNGELTYLSQKAEEVKNSRVFQYVEVLEADEAKEEVQLLPKQQKTLALHIRIPKKEPLADYYFSVIFVSKEVADSQAGKTASKTPVGVATNVLLSVGPKGQTQGLLKEFSTPVYVEKGPLPFTVQVENTGEHLITPQGQILITNMFGQTIGKVELLPSNILAHSSRYLTDLNQSPESKLPLTMNYEQITKNGPKAIWPETFLLGPYSARITLSLSDQGPIYHRTIYFIAFPTYLAIGLLIALAISGFIMYRVKRKM